MKLPFLSRKPAKAAEPVRADERLRVGFEKSPVGIAYVSPDGHWLAANERFRTIIGYAREQLARVSYQYLAHPDDAKREAQMMRSMLEGEIAGYRISKRIQDRTGKFRSVESMTTVVRGESGNPEFLIHVIEEPAASATEMTHSIEDAIDAITSVAIIRTDDHGIVQAWNRGAVRIFGYSDEEMIGKSRRILYRDADDWEEKPTSQLRQASEGRLELEDWRVARGGRHIWVQTTITAIRVDGKIEGFVEVAMPAAGASAAKTAELERTVQSLRAELETSERTNESLREALEEVRVMGEETMKELRIMTGALRKEMDRRKAAEDELRTLKETEVVTEALPPTGDWRELGETTPAELLVAHATPDHTGMLVVATGEWQKEIFFEAGRIFSVASNQPWRFLAQRLVDSGRITEEQRTKALEIRDETQLSIGRILVILGAISEEQLAEEMRAKAKDEIAELFDWRDARYVFVPGEVPALQLVPLRVEVAPLVVRRLNASSEAPAPMLVASSTAKGKKFHRASCNLAARIGESVRIGFASEEEARTRGFEACRVCFAKAEGRKQKAEM
jgi:PAS domain S-box-containing protein